MNDTPNTPTFLAPAPGAKASMVCGILSIVGALTCVCSPVGIVLGIVALVKHTRASRASAEAPEAYTRTSAAGLVTGIIGLALSVLLAIPGLLFLLGMGSSLAIPSLLSQRSRARDQSARENMLGREGDLIGQWDMNREKGASNEQIVATLSAYLRQTTSRDINPWNPSTPAYSYDIKVVSGLDTADDMANAAQSQATNLGEAVFLVEYPQTGKRGFLAGAVRLQNPFDGKHVQTKVSEIE